MDKFLIKAPSWETKKCEMKLQYSNHFTLTMEREMITAMTTKDVQSQSNGYEQCDIENQLPGKLSDYVNENSLSKSAREITCTPSKLFGSDAFVNRSHNRHRNPTTTTTITTTPLQQLCDKEQHLLRTPKTPHRTKQLQQQQQQMMARIQHDLNSPSANVRLRAIRAMKGSTNSPYTQFDVPHAEQSIIMPEERRTPPPPCTLKELMNDIIVYVEVRTGEDNRSDGVKKVISALGARVNDKLLRDTTHVIFKDGLLSTYKKAKNWNIPVVSILWIEACKNQNKICDPNDYPISNADRYENPELYDKMKRQKSMQPDSECNKRVRVKNGTPKDSTPKGATKKTSKLIASTPQSARSHKTDISRYFQMISSSASKVERTATNQRNANAIISNNDNCNSPATPVLATQIDANDLTPMPSTTGHQNPAINDEIALQSSIPHANTPEAVSDAKRMINFNDVLKDADMDVSNLTPISSHSTQRGQRVVQRRRSAIQSTVEMATAYIGEIPSVDTLTPNNNKSTSAIMTRRRKSMCNTTNNNNNNLIRNETTAVDSNFATILEENMNISNVSEQGKGGEVTTVNGKPPAAVNHRQTTFAMQSMNICTPEPNTQCDQQEVKEKVKSNRRRTLYTPKPIEESPMAAGKQLPTIIDDDNTHHYTMIASSTSLKSKTELIDGDATSTTPFSSTRAPGRRRTMFDLSMDIITQRMHNINQSATRRSMALQAQPELNTDAVQRDGIDCETPSKTIAEEQTNANNDNKIAVVDQVVGNCGDIDSNMNHIQNNSNTIAATESSIDNGDCILASQPSVSKKRKLYIPNEESALFITPPALKKTTATSASSHTTTSASLTNMKRRKTLLPFTQPKSDSNLTQSTTKGRRRSTLDFSCTAINAKGTATAPATSSSTTLSAKGATVQEYHCGEISNDICDNGSCVTLRPIGTAPSTVQATALTINNDDNKDKAIDPSQNRGAKRNLRFLVYTNMHKEQIEVIREAVERLGGFELEKNVSKTTTHVISLEPRRTLNMLLGLVRGLWLLEYKWVLDSMQAGKWLYEEQYELQNFSRAVQICRAERQAFGDLYACELFRHLGAFHVSSRCGHLSKESLVQLIKLSGGQVVADRKRAKYILGNVNRAASDDKIHITPFWILDSITQMQLQRFQKYEWNAGDLCSGGKATMPTSQSQKNIQ